jgi:hypothetical protein
MNSFGGLPSNADEIDIIMIMRDYYIMLIKSLHPSYFLNVIK